MLEFAHPVCNMQRKQQNHLPIVFHNLKGFNGHLVLIMRNYTLTIFIGQVQYLCIVSETWRSLLALLASETSACESAKEKTAAVRELEENH